MERWLHDANGLLEHLPVHLRTLEQMQRVGLADAEAQWRRDVLSSLVTELASLRDPDPSRGLMASMQERLAMARTLRRRSLDEASSRWSAAVASIGSVEECPAYTGLRLAPQLGLVPVGRDPQSGLWEFAHLPSGEVPTRAADGALELRPESGLVLVLVPGGSFARGSQAPTPGQPTDARSDPLARENETPRRVETVAPFFLSKYEMTRAQWRRALGAKSAQDPSADSLLPAGMISEPEAARQMRHLGLVLPSESQWECAARATTTTRWWTGNDARSLIGAENAGSGIDANLPYDDGWPELAPVNGLRANPWGLHHMLGNVAEWTADPYRDDAGSGAAPGSRLVAVRGGSFRSSVRELRSSSRAGVPAENRSAEIGVRPARAVE
jgi:formylglycine-generating enzyme required for sulfatase activity